MLSDLVLDTNVLKHADNVIEKRRSDALSLIRLLDDTEIHLCSDLGFNVSEAMNRSRICSEYLNFLVPGSLGHAIIAKLASSSRVKMLPTGVPDAVRRLINNVVHDPTDRVFVRVAYNSVSKKFSTHDEANFPGTCREKIREKADVDILSALEILPLMKADIDR